MDVGGGLLCKYFELLYAKESFSDLTTEVEGPAFGHGLSTAISRTRLVLLGGRSGQVWTFGGLEADMGWRAE
jgi:hypothetical protein